MKNKFHRFGKSIYFVVLISSILPKLAWACSFDSGCPPCDLAAMKQIMTQKYDHHNLNKMLLHYIELKDQIEACGGESTLGGDEAPESEDFDALSAEMEEALGTAADTLKEIFNDIEPLL